MNRDSEILERVCDFFIRSRDFNGIPAAMLSAEFGMSWSCLQERIRELAEANKVSATFESHSMNPHIKRIADLPLEKQLEMLSKEDVGEICIYPARNEILSRSDLSEFDGRPYSRRLACAEPQLVPVFFELSVLERYFRDPRYTCRFGDSDGHISISDAAYNSERTPERDKISLRFGIAYDKERNRVVAVFLRDLSELSPEHQQVWKACEVDGQCTMNSDFERACIWGEWPEYFSVYSAFIQEQIEINKLSKMLGKVPLFRSTFEDHRRPIGFASMLRPTRQSFEEFVLLLDKMLSDNVTRDSSMARFQWKTRSAPEMVP